MLIRHVRWLEGWKVERGGRGRGEGGGGEAKRRSRAERRNVSETINYE